MILAPVAVVKSIKNVVLNTKGMNEVITKEKLTLTRRESQEIVTLPSTFTTQVSDNVNEQK